METNVIARAKQEIKIFERMSLKTSEDILDMLDEIKRICNDSILDTAMSICLIEEVLNREITNDA